MLIYALITNAVFSTLCGIFMFWQHQWLSSHIPLFAADWKSLAMSLIVFAISLVTLASKRNWAIKWAFSILVGDVIWVVLTSVLLISYFSLLSSVGVSLVVAVNLFVGSFAFFQYVGLRHVETSDI